MVDSSTDTLPDSLEQCHALIQTLLATMAEKDFFIERLQHQLRLHLQHRFGRRADTIDLDKPGLFTKEELLAAMGKAVDATPDSPEAPPEAEEKPAADASSSTKKNGHGRQCIPDDLPIDQVVVDVDDEDKQCSECGRDKVIIREDRTKQLEYIPASLHVKETIRPTYACPQHCDGQVFNADKPHSPIEKGLAGPGLLAHVAVSKYGDHLPLHRQENILARHGVKIARSTQCDWMRQCAELVEPLYTLLKDTLRGERYLFSDDTTVKLQQKGQRQTATARMWCYGSQRLNLVAFDFRRDRSRDGPREFLRGCEGYLQADAYAGYDVVFKQRKMMEVACWAHARRKFCDAQDAHPREAAMAVAYIRRLYDIENEAKRLAELDLPADASPTSESADSQATPGPAEAVTANMAKEPRHSDADGTVPVGQTHAIRLAAFERLAAHRLRLRQSHAVGILAEMKAWLDSLAPTTLPKSPLGTALRYLLGRWKSFTRYTTDGHLDMDNNAAERAMRHTAIGRKNWLFAGSKRGRKTMATLTSLIYSAKGNGLDPFAYLRDVFERLPALPASRLAELLPNLWSPL